MIANKEKNILNKEIGQFYTLFFLTIFFVYYTPPLFSKLYFILLLALFWKSKKDYFWFVFVFIVIAQPADLFQGGRATDVHIMPSYTITTGISFGFFDFFFILAFLKALLKGKTTKLILKKPLLYLLFYAIFLFLISFIYGMNLKLITSFFRRLTLFTLALSFPFLVYKKEDFFKIMHLVFPIIFFSIFVQFFHLFTGNTLYSFMIGKGTASIIQLSKTEGYRFIRPMPGGGMLILFSFIFTLFLIEKKDYPGKKSYLYLILMLCALSGFISATRSWILMFALVLLLYFIFVAEKNARLLFRVSSIILILFLSYLFIPRLDYSVDNSLLRLSTLEHLARGDVTADGTLGRIDRRLPRVLEGFKQNPIFGLGFSETNRKYHDYHVGFFDLLLQVGIIGFILFVILWINYLKMIFFTRKRLSKNNVLKKPLLVLVIAFLGMLALQSTFPFFAYDLRSRVAYFTIIFLSFSDFFVKEALKQETSKKTTIVRLAQNSNDRS